ncbi:MAG: hypothetical protein HY879_19350 [Deltaproteobacteria bacterium]|nr:hypothetical protein [Deltaproteobacteria bacterium]
MTDRGFERLCFSKAAPCAVPGARIPNRIKPAGRSPFTRNGVCAVLPVRESVRKNPSWIRTYFRRGGMQVQLNVIDPAVLIAARDDPRAYPYLLVRVSGYSAYFNDLSPAMKDEIIQRTCALG